MKKAIKLILLVLIPFCLQAQNDPLYNQYFFNQAIINPAYTGVNNVLNATALSRTQWAGVEGAPITNTLNVTNSFLKNKIGVGANLIFDRFGINNNTEFSLMYSYKIITPLGNVFSMGLQAGLVNYNYDYNRLNLQYLDDTILNDAQPSVTKENFGFGFWYMSKNYYIGLSVPRLLDVRVNDGGSQSTRYRRHYYLSGGYVFDQLFSFKFKPSILVMYVDNENYAVDINTSFLLNEAIWLGASIRNFSALGLNTQLKIDESIKFGYAFELPINNTALTGLGTHSLMISLDLALFERHALGRRYF
ncbi:PorP/SprF family type IX secretion system membrane protein [Marivirga arenosa]|uniref:Type IX secretion system membrane protein PorP/SprF n=1 Tax=Marivirga arenosa TaxID=3059076 RepID=A0AA49GFP9_9BACT|nr:type IX secretion system membrane protein PorP/SprF [Marivirga sp. BKB1-2]WKK83193.2 type IX secretion system membrane protein PorP/SprF [Marivirga sp. BKB1-2]